MRTAGGASQRAVWPAGVQQRRGSIASSGPFEQISEAGWGRPSRAPPFFLRGIWAECARVATRSLVSRSRSNGPDLLVVSAWPRIPGAQAAQRLKTIIRDTLIRPPTTIAEALIRPARQVGSSIEILRPAVRKWYRS
jgi:hypothetical protein